MRKNTMQCPMTLEYNPARGLTLTWEAANELSFTDLPLRVRLRGANTFLVWGNVDSGEGLPGWAEPDLNLELFGGAAGCRLETISENGRVVGYRAFARHPRAEAILEVRDEDGELAVSLQLRNPQHAGGRGLPLCLAELEIGGLFLGADAEFASAHGYGGRTHGVGRLADLVEPGMPFPHGCIGLALPLLVLHDPATSRGLQLEFMMDGRPTLWLRPAARGDARPSNSRANCALYWAPDRLLQPGQVHAFSGALKLKPVTGRPDQVIRDWRDAADARYGICPPPVPAWVKQRSCIELWLFPGAYKEFTRLDDPALYAMLKRWRDLGYNAIMAVSPNPVVTNFLSPLHYHASETVGGAAAEKVMLGWMHELGFHVGIWFTTVGLDKTAPQVTEHRDWWTHRPNGELFYAWNSNPASNFVGYAPDGDPGSTGWRRFMLGQLASLLERGWNGVFIDGCIPRSSNHARWFWPGEARNAVEDQVAELAEAIRRSGKDAILCDEDSGLASQATAEITTGRYTPMAPFFKKAYWDHGMGGGPKELGEPPPRIPPERAREYLLIRYASLLPGSISEDGVEGYASEEARPWTVVSVLSGPTTFKTHAEYINDPLTFRQLGDAPPAGPQARDPEHRRQGHEEFLRLLRLRADEPLVGADTPLSIEGVQVEGDAAVVGLLRPTAERCLLILINFAERSATVRVRLAEPFDIPAVQRARAGAPQTVTWKARELQHSIAESEALAGPVMVSGVAGAPLTLGAYGFRVLELTR
jgi:hypothetical protein